MPRSGDTVFFEFIQQGAFVRVTAIDAGSGCEAVILGPAAAPRSTLEQAALRKLAYVQKQNGKSR